MSARWFIHSRDRTFGPWTAIQVRDELRAGRVDPFDMACKEGSTVKRPLVEVDEIFQTSRVQMAELVSMPDEETHIEVAHETKRAVNEPEVRAAAQTSREPPSASMLDRPRPSQFQALAAAARLDPPGNEARRPKQYYVTDSTGRSYGPLSSGEVMKLWHSGRLDSRAVVERGNSPKRINIQKFVGFYQNAAPSGVAFLPTRAAQPFQARYITVVSESAPKPLIVIAVLVAAGALVFLGMTMRDHLPPQLSRFIPKSKTVSNIQHFDLKSIESMVINGNATQPSFTPVPRAQEQQQLQPPSSLAPIEIKPTKPGKKIMPKPAPRKRTTAPPRKSYRYVPPADRWAPVNSAAQRPAKPLVKPAPVAASKVKPVMTPAAGASKKEFTDGATQTLSGYRFSQSDLSACNGKCKLPMTGPQGPVTAIFFKEALGKSFEGKTSTVSVTGILRKQPSGSWNIIVSFAR